MPDDIAVKPRQADVLVDHGDGKTVCDPPGVHWGAGIRVLAQAALWYGRL